MESCLLQQLCPTSSVGWFALRTFLPFLVRDDDHSLATKATLDSCFLAGNCHKRAGERSAISLWFHYHTTCYKTTFHLKRYVLGIVWKYARDMFNVQMGQNHPCITGVGQLRGWEGKWGGRWVAVIWIYMNIEFAFLSWCSFPGFCFSLLIADATEKNMHRNLCFASNDFLSNRWLLILAPKWPFSQFSAAIFSKDWVFVWWSRKAMKSPLRDCHGCLDIGS